MNFTAVLEKFEGNLWSYYLVVPVSIALPYISDDGDRRVVCTLNNQTEFQCALMHKGDGNFFININKKIRDSLKLKLATQVSVSLRKDESEYGLPMPDELNETLLQDEDGHEIFHALSPGKQRTLIYIASSVKDTQKRINRAIAIVTHLKSTNGKINFKQLNELLKIKN
ncbi:MAG: DUF1905 domain-containing protein [Opitutaceae bacterium]|nr:DUF1905 domain-containing protein [Cytophagales bacterium]